MPTCGNNCLIIRQPVGNFPPPPVLVRTVHNGCIHCRNNVSEYGHLVCYSCANRNLNPVEFNYHHYRCFINPIAPQANWSSDTDDAPNPN